MYAGPVGEGDPDLEAMGFTDLVRLRNRISDALTRRFERRLALVFADLVDSTLYVARFGNEAGRALQQRFYDFTTAAVTAHAGRIVDTAGDGAFCCFAQADDAAAALCALHRAIADETIEDAHRISVRTGLHVGAVLTDGSAVSGEAVNASARVTATAAGAEIRVTRAAFEALSETWRARCRPIGVVSLKGIAEPMPLLSMRWTDDAQTPIAVRIEETQQEIALPSKDVVRFGRLREQAGVAVNDVVLSLPDDKAAVEISRWHFELRRRSSGWVLRAVSDRPTEVDGVRLARGDESPVRVGTKVRVSNVMTLTFVAESLTRSAFATGAR